MEQHMKMKFRRLAAVCLAAALCTSTAQAVVKNGAGETLVRVGLASSATGVSHEELIGANLWNAEGYGAGYRFGYFDADYNFVELGRTRSDMVQVSVIKTQNTWFKGSDRNSYSNTDNGGTVVGCYHLQLPGNYLSYEAAAADAAGCGGFVAYINGVYQVRAGSYTDRAGAEAAQAAIPNSKIVGTSSYGINVIQSGTSNILFQYDMGNGTRLAVIPDVTGKRDVRTWFWGIKYRGGFTYQRFGGGNLTVANVVELEDYVKGVAPYEMGRSWPLEALKAQAICARTYVMRQSRHNSLGFDVCSSDHCQVYNGTGSNSSGWGPTTTSDRAVDETAGQVLWYQDRLAETFYSSSHGGASEDAKYIWGTDTTTKYPYLCGVLDPYEKDADSINSRSSWKVAYTTGELTKRLNGKGFGVGTTVDHLVLTYSKLGNVIKMEVHWANGQKNTFKPGSIRSTFGLNSIRFTVNGQTANPSESKPGSYLVNGGQQLSSLDGVYAINGSGITGKMPGTPYTIDGSEQITALKPQNPGDPGTNEGGGTVKVSGSTYTFNGAGWGHQVGMSQFGAYAMAKRGLPYDQICEFYFPGTNVGPAKF